MVNSKITVSNLPKLTRDNQCYWLLPKQFRENEGMILLGRLQEYLQKTSISSTIIDLKDVEWADPQPLLALSLLLAESNINKKNRIVKLGSVAPKNGDYAHQIFLKFFAQQGFLTAMASHATLHFEKKYILTDKEIIDTRISLSNKHVDTHFLGSDCIYARVISAHDLRNQETKLKDQVEIMIHEAQQLIRPNAFGGNLLAGDVLLQKLRKLLFELLANIAEHSHSAERSAFAGVYARIRSAKPTLGPQADKWDELYKKGKIIYGQGDFLPNPYADWLELYVCDIGNGLLSQIKHWHEPNDQEVRVALKQAKNSTNPLESIFNFLFRSPLSRNPRHDAEKTAVTGLQHLGLILKPNRDYCRLYTQRGSWVGGHLPWTPQYSRKDLRLGHRDAAMQKLYGQLEPISGTAYCFSIQPNYRNIFTALLPVPTVAEETKTAILQALRYKKSYNTLLALTWYDKRNDNECQAPSQNDLEIASPNIIVLRPPRLMSKADFARWLALLAGYHLTPPVHPVTDFILADLSPFQLLIFRELMRHVLAGFSSKMNLYLVTERWEVCAFRTDEGNSSFLEYSPLDFNHKTGSPPSDFSIADLAVVLRQMDSELFWMPNEDGSFDPFFNERVGWPVGWEKEAKIHLERYLDFPQALAEPTRYRACRRALRRCLALFQNKTYRASDDLIASLVKELQTSDSSFNNNTDPGVLIVGSIAVTAGTVRRLEQEYCGQVVHMMVHGEADTALRETKPLAALLWASDLPEFEPMKSAMAPSSDSGKPWRRIPRTPYIAPLGEQAISLLRYKRNDDGTLNFSDSWYKRTPEQTYQDFGRLGIIKTGHWAYGSKHDLITINVGLALLHAFIELGPLYTWLRDQFQELFYSAPEQEAAKAQLLIYPSHPVTDALFNRLRQDEGFKDRLPSAGIIPMKFLGSSTVSPLLASPLVAARIKDRVERFDSWAAVIVDDGVISGKHMREQTQFVQSLGARRVYSLAILDRSGLPAQENVLNKYFDRHQRFWRWDVPPLGNKRECPLCKALLITQTFAERLTSERQKSRLGQWEKMWAERDVEKDWYSSGLSPVSFTQPVKVTFGVDAHIDGTRNEKILELDSSTTLAAVTLELTRLTTRSDVAVKKADFVIDQSIDAAIEIIASQLLLFFDELSIAERRDRYKKLFTLIWTTSKLTTATSLVGLCITLLEREAIEDVWNYCTNEMLPNYRLGNLDAILATRILLFRHAYQTGQSYRCATTGTEAERFNYVMLGGDGTLRDHIRDFLTIFTNPNIYDRPSCHTSELYKQLSDCKNIFCDNSNIELINNLSLNKLRQDCRFAEQICRELVDSHVVSDPKGYLTRFQELLGTLDELSASSTTTPVNFRDPIQSLMDLLFNKNNGLLSYFADQLLIYYRDDEQLDNRLISQLARDLRMRWSTFVKGKETDLSYSNSTKQRWLGTQGEIIKPVFMQSKTEKLNDIWFYCDALIKGLINDSLSNVYHSNKRIPDPWIIKKANADSTTAPEADLWWRARKDSNNLVIELCNGTNNGQIDYIKQTMNLAGLDRIGGKLSVIIDIEVTNGPCAFTTLHIPLCTSFQKEKS